MRSTRYDGIFSVIRDTSHVTHHTSLVTRHTQFVQDGSGDLDLGELNAVLASISGGAMSAGDDDRWFHCSSGEIMHYRCKHPPTKRMLQVMQELSSSARALKIWREERAGVGQKVRLITEMPFELFWC